MTLTITRDMAQAAAERFWAKVRTEPGPCWEWQAKLRGAGYGSLRLKSEAGSAMARAHRISYVLHHGEIPESMVVRHTCDNPSCVNPSHLLLGTQADNVADRVRRGRSYDLRGENNHSSKLNAEAVRQILALLASPNPPKQKDIAAQFGVSCETICAIKKRRNWAHVT
jgi:HNH endonuclease